jgi:hypothetical protein
LLLQKTAKQIDDEIIEAVNVPIDLGIHGLHPELISSY